MPRYGVAISSDPSIPQILLSAIWNPHFHMDILLTHGYFLYEDPHELQVMKPYPTLGLLYVASHLKAKGFDVEVFDSTFSSWDAFEQRLHAARPGLMGIYTNLMTKQTVLRMLRLAKALGVRVALGGPEPPHYAAEYLLAGADVVVIGEGELTLEELIPHLQAGHGWAGPGPRDCVPQRRRRSVRTPPRPQSPTYRPSHGPIEKPSTWSATCRPGRHTTAFARPR